MVFACTTPVEEPWVRQDRQLILGSFGEADVMTANCFIAEDIEADTFDSRGGSAEAFVDDLFIESDCFEDLSPFVTLQSRDAHFSHHFEDALLRSFTVQLDDFFVAVFLFEQSIFASLSQGFKRQVRIDGIGTVAGQSAEVMHFASFARFHNDPDASP